MSWVAFGVGLILLLYENHYVTRGMLGRPRWYSAKGQAVLSIVRYAITLGSLAGLWYQFGVLTAVGAFAVYVPVSALTFERSFRREVRKQLEGYRQMLHAEAVEKGETPDLAAIEGEASRLAHYTVERHSRGQI